MARSFARIPLIKPGDDWSTLTPMQQWAITFLERIPKMNFAGVVDVKISRWVNAAKGLDDTRLVAVLQELEGLDWIRWDRDTEELAVRDHCRQDHVTQNYKSARGLWGAWDATESTDIREWLLTHFPLAAWDEVNKPLTEPPTDRTIERPMDRPISTTSTCGKPPTDRPIDPPTDPPMDRTIEPPNDPPIERSKEPPIDHPSNRRSITDGSDDRTPDRSIQPSATATAFSLQPAGKSRDAFNNANPPPVDNSELRTARLINQFTNTATSPDTPTPETLRTEIHHLIADLPPDTTDDQVLAALTRRVEHLNGRAAYATR